MKKVEQDLRVLIRCDFQDWNEGLKLMLTVVQKNLAEKQHKHTVARLEKQIEQQKGYELRFSFV
jgi:hypothetical protein